MMMMMMMIIMMMLQSVYLNDQHSVVMELDKNCNENTPPLSAALSGLLFTKLGNVHWFLPRDNIHVYMQSALYAIARPSVCLSHS